VGKAANHLKEEEGGGVLSSAATGNVNDGPADAAVVEVMKVVDAKASGGEDGQDITGDEAVAAAEVEDTIIADPQQQQQQQDEEEVVVKKVKKTKLKKSNSGGVKPTASGFATRKIKKVRSAQMILISSSFLQSFLQCAALHQHTHPTLFFSTISMYTDL
jgi:hypothetical protein